jgi:hypothetical protein
MVVKLQVFRIITTLTTFEADDFDWGECDEQGEQFLTFFRDGEVIYCFNIQEVQEIIRIQWPQLVKDRLREAHTSVN